MRNSLLFILLSLGIVGCADDDMSGRIYGRVSIEDGIVAVDAMMSLYTSGILAQQKKTDAKGFYEFKDLSPLKDYRLEAELDGYASSSNIVGLLKSKQMNVDVSLKKVSTTECWILESSNLMVQKRDLSSDADWDTALQLCKSSRLGGYTDWHLPTRSELQEIYKNQSVIGKLYGGYWSKDSYDSNWYYFFDMSSGYYQSDYIKRLYKVRAVRSIN